MSSGKNKKTGKYRGGETLPDGLTEKKFTVTKRFFVWLVLWFVAFNMTQLLRAKASNLFFGFTTFFPVASLVYVLISKAVLKVYMLSDSSTAEKNKPFTYEFKVINESVIPYPFIDAVMRLPLPNSVRCSLRCVKLPAAPQSDYTASGTISFRFRGTYEIGVKSLYVYDFFRMFQLKIQSESYNTVSVLPRRLNDFSPVEQAVSDSTAKTKKSSVSVDKLEVSDVREYRLGDSLKSIHWNLSSKSEEFVVRDYNTGTTDTTCVFCDLSARFPTEPPEKEFVSPYDDSPAPAPDVHELASDAFYEDMNEYCADGVVELAIASVLREIRSGRAVRLLWYDNRSDIGFYNFELHTVHDLESVFRLFATAPMADASEKVSGLCSAISTSEEIKYLFVIPVINDDTIADLCSMPCTSDTSSYGENEVIVYSADERFAHPSERRTYIEGCRAQLAGSGLRLIEGTTDDLSVMSGGKEDERQ